MTVTTCSTAVSHVTTPPKVQLGRHQQHPLDSGTEVFDVSLLDTEQRETHTIVDDATNKRTVTSGLEQAGACGCRQVDSVASDMK